VDFGVSRKGHEFEGIVSVEGIEKSVQKNKFLNSIWASWRSLNEPLFILFSYIVDTLL
jgi:hypothetical protein